MKITFPHVEDYLEVIAGKKNLPGTAQVAHSFWVAYAPIISLARYDNGFLDNVTDQTTNGGALTDRQAELAVKLITKYRRQLAAQNIEVADMTAPQFRRPLRTVDRSKSAGIEDGRIYLKFPYETKTIDVIRSMSKESQGYMLFDRDTKIWKIALTEYNVNWVYCYAKENGFAIDENLSLLMQKIMECEQQDYKILLHYDQQGLQIKNAHPRLVSYIEHRVGGLDDANLFRLVDASCVLGYEIDSMIKDHVEHAVGGSTALLMLNREYDFNNAVDVETRVVEYALKTNRFPIVVFNPTSISTESEWVKHFEPEQVLVVNNKKEIEYSNDIKLIYTHKPLRNLKAIPLLISYVGMMIGTEKQIMSAQAEKIFYTAKKLKA